LRVGQNLVVKIRFFFCEAAYLPEARTLQFEGS